MPNWPLDRDIVASISDLHGLKRSLRFKDISHIPMGQMEEMPNFVWNKMGPVGSAMTNNVHVKMPVRYPYLSLKEFHLVKPPPVIEAHSRIYTG